MRYIAAFLSALKPPNLGSWVALVGAGLLSADAYTDWAKYRDVINSWQTVVVMPATITVWHVIAALLFVIALLLAHRETIRILQAARITFDAPFVRRTVDLWPAPAVRVIGAIPKPIGQNDIATIVIRNRPRDGEHGRNVENAFASVTFFDPTTHERVLEFDYPRWEANPKPGYHSNPIDHYPDDWNRRTLRASGEANTLNFLLKSINDECAYGFRGLSQMQHMWHDPDLRLPPGEYIARLTISGVGLASCAVQWLSVAVGGSGKSVDVEKTKRRDISKWW